MIGRIDWCWILWPWILWVKKCVAISTSQSSHPTWNQSISPYRCLANIFFCHRDNFIAKIQTASPSHWSPKTQSWELPCWLGKGPAPFHLIWLIQNDYRFQLRTLEVTFFEVTVFSIDTTSQVGHSQSLLVQNFITCILSLVCLDARGPTIFLTIKFGQSYTRRSVLPITHSSNPLDWDNLLIRLSNSNTCG